MGISGKGAMATGATARPGTAPAAQKVKAIGVAKAKGYDPLAPQRIQEILKRLRTGFKQAAEAEQYAARGDNINAIAQWRKIMPIHFPAHG